MHVAIVIVGFRNSGDIVQCLGAIAGSSHRDFEVVICENGGRDAFDALQRVVPSHLVGGQLVSIVMAPGNLGYAGGVNLGMANAPAADAWWVLNPDTLPEPDAMAICVQRLERGDCDAVGCTVYWPDRRVQSHGGRWRWAFARTIALGSGTPLSAPVDPDEIERTQNYLHGACMMIGRRFLEVVGPMEEAYFLYCEEVEWFLRAGKRGMRLSYAHGARVLHAAGTTTGTHRPFKQLPKTPVYLNERNRILVTRDCSPIWLPVAAVGAVLVAVVRYGRRGAWRQLGYALEGWLAGLFNKRGRPSWIEP